MHTLAHANADPTPTFRALTLQKKESIFMSLYGGEGCQLIILAKREKRECDYQKRARTRGALINRHMLITTGIEVANDLPHTLTYVCVCVCVVCGGMFRVGEVLRRASAQCGKQGG
jgi:hypothetical protein